MLRILVIRSAARLTIRRSPRRLHARRLSLMSSTSSFQGFKFGPHPIKAEQAFAQSSQSIAFVNLKPIVPGHVLISPKRVIPRFTQLSAEEVADLWTLAQTVGGRLELYYDASSLTLAIQDGPAAGQSVPHVHIHVLPRKEGDFERNDDVYDALDRNAKEYSGPQKVDMDAGRRVRTDDEMSAEATELRKLFE